MWRRRQFLLASRRFVAHDHVARDSGLHVLQTVLVVVVNGEHVRHVVVDSWGGAVPGLRRPAQRPGDTAFADAEVERVHGGRDLLQPEMYLKFNSAEGTVLLAKREHRT